MAQASTDASGRRLPQLDTGAVGIHDPAEASELAFIDALVDLHARSAQLRQQCVEIVDAVVTMNGCVLGAKQVVSAANADHSV